MTIEQPVPALHFDGPELAEDALIEWAAAKATLDDQRDLIVSGARTAGVKPAEIGRLTGLAATTISRIPAAPVAVPLPPAMEYAVILRTRAARHQDQANRTTESGGNHEGRAVAFRYAALAVRGGRENISGAFLMGILDTADARLAALAGIYRREAAELTLATNPTAWQRGFHAGSREALDALADEITKIRRIGEDALPAAELAHARAVLTSESQPRETEVPGLGQQA
ncbi:hypothetical protein [Streptomyces sp. NPDC058622]|uniref:hypothetical protein n=1 Tax=unclassified Streptomyces TaxID=2593676 RepID=UPI0036563D91